MPTDPLRMPPKRSLGIFKGLGEVLDKRKQRQIADEDRQQKLEDRVFGSIRQGQQDMANEEMRTLEKALMEERINEMRRPPIAKPNRTYDASRGVIVDLDGLKATPLGLPDKQDDVNWQTQETDGGFVQVNPRTGQTRPLNIQPPRKRTSDNGAAVTRELQREKMLADEYRADPHVKTAYGVAQAAAQIRAAAQRVNNPQGDLDIIYSVVKIRDPNSVVREGEIDLQKAARSLGTQIAQAWQKAKSGRMLTPEERAAIVGLVGVKEDALRQQIAPVQKRFGAQARRFGADSAFVAPSPFDMGATGSPDAPTPASLWLQRKRGGG